MKKFLKNVTLFFIPFAIVVCIIIYVDIFKAFREYDDYYKNNFVTLNRELVCTNVFNKNREKEKFDSFVFGNSRSRVFRVQEWKTYLDKDVVPFHFDASGDGVYGVANKVKYIDEVGDTIKNALIILDREFLVTTHNREGHLFISPPCLSKESKLRYYLEFMKASIDFKFLYAYIDFSIFKTHKEYMGRLINTTKYSHASDNVNCDWKYGYEQQIKEDSIEFYGPLMKQGVFYDRKNHKKNTCRISELEIKQLKEIKAVFTRHHTNYKLIIAPIYDQIEMDKEQLDLLNEVFGAATIYNYSGVNKFTIPIGNYYETSHFRPRVASEILKEVYEGNRME